MKFSKKVMRVSAITLLALLLFLLIRHFIFPASEPVYLTVPVVLMDIEDVVLAGGTIKPLRAVNVGAQVNGQLKAIKVKLGESVKKGQLLAEIDPVLQANALRKAELELKVAQAQKQSKQALLKLHEANFRRQQLMSEGDATPLAELENAQAQLDVVRADLQVLDAQIKQAILDVDSAKANLGYTQITAPIDGEVINMITEEGQTVVSAQSAPTIMVLANLDKMQVKAKISEADVMRIKPGCPVYFTILGMPDKRFQSTLKAIEPAPEISDANATNAQSSTTAAVYYNSLFEIANPDQLLKPSMTAQVSLVLNSVKNVLAIPVTALGKKIAEGQYEVRVLDKKNQPQARVIHTGLNNHIHVQVLKGLQANEKVILTDSAVTNETTESDSVSIVF